MFCKNFALTFSLFTTLLSFTATHALAENHNVQMLNKGKDGAMVFEPAFIAAQPGDTITFLATDKSHNAASITDMLPEGVEDFKGKVNEDYVLTVETPGLYGVKCTPHLAMGMVALIQVGGDTSNRDTIVEGKLPKKARERMDAALAEVIDGGT